MPDAYISSPCLDSVMLLVTGCPYWTPIDTQIGPSITDILFISLIPPRKSQRRQTFLPQGPFGPAENWNSFLLTFRVASVSPQTLIWSPFSSETSVSPWYSCNHESFELSIWSREIPERAQKPFLWSVEGERPCLRIERRGKSSRNEFRRKSTGVEPAPLS